MANAFLSGYIKRRYRGFESNDAVKENWAKLIVGYAGAGSDADGKIYNLDCRADFNDFALARFASGSNTRQKEWKEKYTANTFADKWFKPTESYSSVLTGNAAATQKVVDVNDASGFVADDWCVIARDDGTDEFIQIDSISTNEITFKTDLANAYTTADNAKVMLGYYIYYDNAGDAADYQDGANVFAQFDDFERGNDGDEVGGSWTEDDGICEISTAQSFGGTRSMKLEGTVAWPIIHIDVTPSSAIAIRFRFRKEAAAIWYMSHGNGTKKVYFKAEEADNDNELKSWDGTWHDTGADAVPDTWDLIEFRDFDWSSYIYDIGWADTGSIATLIQNAAAMNEVGTDSGVAELTGMNQVGQDTWIDDFIIRNYPDIAGAGFGAEEEEVTDWVSPTNFVDYSGKWTDESLAYDEGLGTYAYSDDDGHGLGLTHTDILCSKIRVYFREPGAGPTMDCTVTAWRDGGQVKSWGSGPWNTGEWVEFLLDSLAVIDEILIYAHSNDPVAYIYEADFYEVDLVAPEVSTQAVTDILTTTATGNGTIDATGGENCDHRGVVYGTTSKNNPDDTAYDATDYDGYVDESGSFEAGAFTRSLTSLSAGQTYYVRAYAHNSIEYVYGDEVDFKTNFAQSTGNGAITPTGALNRIIKLLTGSGAITPIGVLTTVRNIFQTVGEGAITPVGELNRIIKLLVGEGSITPIGTLTAVKKFFQDVGQGAITAVGELNRKIILTIGQGAITPVGTLGRKIKLLVGEGTITPVGTLISVIKFFINVGSGAITPVGALALKIKLAVGSGAITPTGALNRLIKLLVGEGSITPTGALTAVVKFFLSVGQGVITPIGTLGRKIKLAVGSGAVTPTGALTAIKKILQSVGAGAITPVGTLGRKIKLLVGAGAITPIGALGTVRNIFQAVGQGVITPIGELGRKIMLTVGSGAITPTGALNRLIKLLVGSGSITPVGVLNRGVRFFVNVGQGAVTIAGALNRKIKLTIGQGAITPVSALAWGMVRNLILKVNEGNIYRMVVNEGVIYRLKTITGKIYRMITKEGA